MVTNNKSAEYGRSSGATINVASQSGTNHFHATLYEFIRNTDLNAAGFFKPNVVGNTGITTPFKKPTFNRNQYGINFGGPIIKDKLFFFLDYEGFRQMLSPLSVLTLPTQNELNGILVVPVKNAITERYTRQTRRFLPALSIPLSQQIISYFTISELQFRLQALPTTGLASNDYPSRSRSRTTPTRVICDSITSRSTQTVHGSCASATARRTGSTIPPFRFRWTARPTARSEFSISRLRLDILTCSARTRSWTLRLGLDRTKAGKYTSPSADTAFNSIPGLPTTRSSPAACRLSASRGSPDSAGRARTRSGRIRRSSIPR